MALDNISTLVYKWSGKSELRNLWWFQIEKTSLVSWFISTYFSALMVNIAPVWTCQLPRSCAEVEVLSPTQRRSPWIPPSAITIEHVCPPLLLTPFTNWWPIFCQDLLWPYIDIKPRVYNVRELGKYVKVVIMIPSQQKISDKWCYNAGPTLYQH